MDNLKSGKNALNQADGVTQYWDCPELVKKMPLDKPVLIEAAAGTGKTYTIEHLLARMLLESPPALRCPELEEILVITFTEKAAGELKERIRLRLQALVSQSTLPQEHKQRLNAAVLGFERASIFTIHGFCRKVLQDFSFETGFAFGSELVDQSDVLEQVFDECLAGGWAKQWKYFPELIPLLHLKEHAGESAPLLDLAKKCDFEGGARLSPEEANQTTWQTFIESWNSYITLCKKAGDSLESSDILSAYPNIKMNGKTRKANVNNVLKPLIAFALEEELFGEGKLDRDEITVYALRWTRLTQALQENSSTKEKLKKSGFSFLRDKLSEADVADIFPVLNKLIVALDSISQTAEHIISACFGTLARDLQRRAQEKKDSKALFSFDDLITKLRNALYASPNKNLLIQKLRKRFPVAIVDEFQDTDIKQWDILQCIYGDMQPSRLFLIGDPKQAIYRFRGADIFTYFEARAWIEKKGVLLSLDMNYRSSEIMIKAFNHLFKKPSTAENHWFSNQDQDGRAFTIPGTEIGYRELRIGTDSHHFKLKESSPIFLWDARQLSTVAEIRSGYAKWIAQEILKLKNKGIAWNEIGILGRGHGEFNVIEWYLAKSEIPYRAYRRLGLYQGVEARYVLALLSALAKPEDWRRVQRLLLSPFLQAPISETPKIISKSGIGNLISDSKINGSHASLNSASLLSPQASKLWAEWQVLASQKKWSSLFRSCLETSGALSRLMLTEGGELQVENIRFIAWSLEQEAYQSGCDVHGLKVQLQKWRSYKSVNNENNRVPLDSNLPKVQMMTMHTSKGLEFRVVFVVGGLSSPTSRPLSFHQQIVNGKRCSVFHLPDADKTLGQSEEAMEERRLYYVAFTRAKERLYLPLLNPENHSRAGALSSWVPEIIETKQAEVTDYFTIVGGQELVLNKSEGNQKTELSENFENNEKNQDYEKDTGESRKESRVITVDELSHEIQRIPWLEKVKGLDLYHQTLRSESFSSLSRGMDEVHMIALGLRQRVNDETDGFTSGSETLEDNGLTLTSDSKAVSASQTKSTPGENFFKILRPGPQTGNALHAILEEMDFVWAKVDSYQNMLEDERFTSLLLKHLSPLGLEDCSDHCASLIWNTLNSLLPEAEKSEQFFCLAEIPKSDRLPEFEFWMPISSNKKDTKTVLLDTHLQGYITGFLDLVFRRDNRYYLLDWKSNLLPDYSPDSLDMAMKIHHYDLQLEIYCVALHHWLKSRKRDYQPKLHFGRVYYAFMRGMQSGESSSVYMCQPQSSALLESFPRNISERLGYGNFVLGKTV